MKNILSTLLVFILMIPAISTEAQTGKKDTTGQKVNAAMHKEGYVTMKGGKLIEYSNGEWGYLMDTYQCNNGDKISTDGTITHADGSTSKMVNGDKIYKDGHMGEAGNRVKKNSSREANPPK